MMNYHRNKNPKTAKVIALIVFFCLILLFVFTPIVRWSFDGLEGVFLGASRNNEDTIGIISSIFKSNKQLKELKDLRAENESLRAKLVILLDREDVEIEEKNYADLYKSDSQILRVSMRPPASGFDILILEKKPETFVNIGDLVITDGNIILGKVENVFDRTVRVKLFTYIEEETLGLFIPQEIEQKLIGNGNNNFKIQIPREIEINEGDRIYYASGQDYLIGIVRKIIFDARDPYKTVLAAIPINIQHLRYVEIIR